MLVALVPVKVIAGLRDELIQEFVEVVTVHASVACTRNCMPEMPNHGIDEKELPVPVPIVSP